VNESERAHLLALAARTRRTAVDEACAKGGPPLYNDGGEGSVDFVALDDALNALAQVDERRSQIVELRFFGRLTVEEIADVFDISVATAQSDWSSAKMWLRRKMTGGHA
jgi:DNA-directed RNA polymerase specialized sigma24 family protein